MSALPWRLVVKHGPERKEDYAWVVADDGTFICTLKTYQARYVVRSANSYADMLSALKQIVRDWDGEPEDMAEARAAIAKAEAPTA